MNDTYEPRRLFESDDAPVGLRRLLERARDDVPTPATVELLVRGAAQRAQVSSLGPAVRRHWFAHGARRATKFLAAVAIIGTGAGLWYRGGGRGDGQAAQVSKVAAVAPEAPMPAATPAPAAAIPALRVSPTADATARDRGASLPRRGHGVTGRLASETETAVSTDTAAAPATGEEFRLLRSAREALADNPARALQLTELHVRRFAHGMLVQEREAIAVEALAQMGREAQAKARARSFVASYPSSPHRSRVERAIVRFSATEP